MTATSKPETDTKPEETPLPTMPPIQAAPPAPPINPQMPIQLVLTVEQVNICLAGLSKLPLETALNTFQSLKGQGDMAIAVSQNIAGKVPQETAPSANGTRPGKRHAR